MTRASEIESGASENNGVFFDFTAILGEGYCRGAVAKFTEKRSHQTEIERYLSGSNPAGNS